MHVLLMLALLANGDRLWVADESSDRLLAFERLGPDGGMVLVSEVALERGASPTGLAVDAHGTLWVAEIGLHRIDGIGPSGTIVASIDEGLAGPISLACDQLGRLWVLNLFSRAISVYDESQLRERRVGRPAVQIGLDVVLPTAIAFDRIGNLYVADALTSRIERFAAEAVLAPDPFLTPTAYLYSAQLAQPTGLAGAPNGDLWVTSGTPGFVSRFRADDLSVHGAAQVIGDVRRYDGFLAPRGIAVTQDGDLWVTDFLRRYLWRFAGLSSSPSGDNWTTPGEIVTVDGFIFASFSAVALQPRP
jgi:sugar lactone lactonase YvrE